MITAEHRKGKGPCTKYTLLNWTEKKQTQIFSELKKITTRICICA